MYARPTTVHADPQRIDDGIAHVRDEVMPAVQSMPGCMGLSMLCDRDSGRCIVTTSWDSEESMRASRDAVLLLLKRATDVQEWEIAVLHRAHQAPDGACCRVTWTRGHPAGMDDMIEALRTGILPRLDEIPGFCSISVLVDRRTGASILTTTYDDRAALEAATGAVRGMGQQFAQQIVLAVTDMAQFELAVHHLRVPEMA